MPRQLMLLLALLCAACGSSAKPDRAKAPDEIREAVFRYLFAQAQHSGPRVYFLKVSGEDPADEFLRRFTEADLVVRKGSESQQSTFPVDKKTGARGVLCEAGEIKWIGNNSAELTAGYRIGQQSGARFLFFLKWDKGKWKITGKKFVGLS